MNTSVSDDNWGARHHRIFHSGTLITEVLFKWFCCVTGWSMAPLLPFGMGLPVILLLFANKQFSKLL